MTISFGRGDWPTFARRGMLNALRFQKLSLWRLAEPFQVYRAQFWAWYATINQSQLWLEARKL
jgi:hypothetical protein